ncbi:MAG: energy transducer TonB [Acidobacteriota bacterium]|nr:energy transducer TonB [Acidobacteriota bacterium]
MFDTLVESTKRKNGKRASRYFVVTTAIYAVALVAIGVGTIIGFSPALAEEHSLIGMLAPPLPNNAPPTVMAKNIPNIKPDISAGFVAPVKTPIEFPDPYKVQPAGPKPGPVVFNRDFPFTNSGGSGTGIGTSKDTIPDPPPPPDIKKVEIKPPPTPETPKKPTAVSEGVLQGSAIRKQRPTYPPIAKAARVSGPVQVVVTISEQGKVIDAYAADGNPLLRQAAVEAARQWLFTPTTLSKVPVKVQGMLTFNFVLQ